MSTKGSSTRTLTRTVPTRVQFIRDPPSSVDGRYTSPALETQLAVEPYFEGGKRSTTWSVAAIKEGVDRLLASETKNLAARATCIVELTTVFAPPGYETVVIVWFRCHVMGRTRSAMNDFLIDMANSKGVRLQSESLFEKNGDAVVFKASASEGHTARATLPPSKRRRTEDGLSPTLSTSVVVNDVNRAPKRQKRQTEGKQRAGTAAVHDSVRANTNSGDESQMVVEYALPMAHAVTGPSATPARPEEDPPSANIVVPQKCAVRIEVPAAVYRRQDFIRSVRDVLEDRVSCDISTEVEDTLQERLPVTIPDQPHTFQYWCTFAGDIFPTIVTEEEVKSLLEERARKYAEEWNNKPENRFWEGDTFISAAVIAFCEGPLRHSHGSLREAIRRFEARMPLVVHNKSGKPKSWIYLYGDLMRPIRTSVVLDILDTYHGVIVHCNRTSQTVEERIRGLVEIECWRRFSIRDRRVCPGPFSYESFATGSFADFVRQDDKKTELNKLTNKAYATRHAQTIVLSETTTSITRLPERATAVSSSLPAPAPLPVPYTPILFTKQAFISAELCRLPLRILSLETAQARASCLEAVFPSELGDTPQTAEYLIHHAGSLCDKPAETLELMAMYQGACVHFESTTNDPQAWLDGLKGIRWYIETHLPHPDRDLPYPKFLGLDKVYQGAIERFVWEQHSEYVHMPVKKYSSLGTGTDT